MYDLHWLCLLGHPYIEMKVPGLPNDVLCCISDFSGTATCSMCVREGGLSCSGDIYTTVCEERVILRQ